MGSETNDIIEELRESLQKYQEGLEESMRGSEFVCDSIDLLYYHLHRLSLSLRRKIRSIMMRLRNQVIQANHLGGEIDLTINKNN